jgi:hypothetical protein
VSPNGTLVGLSSHRLTHITFLGSIATTFRPGSKKCRVLRTRGTVMVNICTGGKVIANFATSWLRQPRFKHADYAFNARQRYASKAAVLYVQSQHIMGLLQITEICA